MMPLENRGLEQILIMRILEALIRLDLEMNKVSLVYFLIITFIYLKFSFPMNILDVCSYMLCILEEF